MSRRLRSVLSRRDTSIPVLRNGDRLTQAEFHRRYENYPDDVRFELIGGIVYETSSVNVPHGSYAAEICGPLGLYKAATPGIEAMIRVTTILGKTSEVQPDLMLRVLPECGGQTRDTPDDYVAGGPELIAEIAYSTCSIDMHQKKEDYRRAGVLEYLVWCIAEQELHWFRFKSRRRIQPDGLGIFRSHVFPGLWIDSRAFAEQNSTRLMEVVQQGIAGPEHAVFVKKLEAARRKKK